MPFPSSLSTIFVGACLREVELGPQAAADRRGYDDHRERDGTPAPCAGEASGGKHRRDTGSTHMGSRDHPRDVACEISAAARRFGGEPFPVTYPYWALDAAGRTSNWLLQGNEGSGRIRSERPSRGPEISPAATDSASEDRSPRLSKGFGSTPGRTRTPTVPIRSQNQGVRIALAHRWKPWWCKGFRRGRYWD